MKAYEGGKRTRILTVRPERKKRKYKNKLGDYPELGCNRVMQSKVRQKIKDE